MDKDEEALFLELKEEILATARQAAHSPILKARAGKTVNKLLAATGGDLSSLVKNMPRYGIPTTRKDFDMYYATTSHHDTTGRETVEDKSHLAGNPLDIAIAAVDNATNTKYGLASVIAVMQERSIDPALYIQFILHAVLSPAEIDLTKLDPRLSEEERKYVEASALISRKILEDSMIASTAEDAPPHSRWANRIKLQRGFAHDQDKPQRLN